MYNSTMTIPAKSMELGTCSAHIWIHIQKKNYRKYKDPNALCRRLVHGRTIFGRVDIYSEADNFLIHLSHFYPS